MKSLRNLLLMLVVSGVLAASVLTASSMWGMRQEHVSAQRALVAKDVTADILPPPMYLIELRLVLSQAVEGSLPLEQARSEVARLKAEYQRRVDYWHAHPPYGLEKHLFGVQDKEARALMVAADGVLEALASGNRAAARAALTKAHQRYLAHRAGVDATVKASVAFAGKALANLGSTEQGLQRTQWTVFGVAVVLLVLLGYWVRRTVFSATGGEPAEVARVAGAVASGDLSVEVPLRQGDEASVMAAMKRMRDNLARIVGEVREASESMASASVQIAEGNQDLSSRTESQASALEETAAAMEELNSTVRQNDENARHADELARSASTVATDGGAVVDRVVGAMKDIRESASSIGDIIGVIDGIAFQTNILALNAAVEAARAGEAGRGFAVVATEVRALAGRCADAAREIRGLIEASAERVEQGASLAGDAGTTMEQVVGSISRVTQIMAEISAASSEQSNGVAQVSDAVGQMDQATQQNAAMVEEIAAAAQSLREQADRLVQVVSVFKLSPSASILPMPSERSLAPVGREGLLTDVAAAA